MVYQFTRPEYTQLERQIQAQRWTILEGIIDLGVELATTRLNQRFGTAYSIADVQAIADRYQSTRTVVRG